MKTSAVSRTPGWDYSPLLDTLNKGMKSDIFQINRSSPRQDGGGGGGGYLAHMACIWAVMYTGVIVMRFFKEVLTGSMFLGGIVALSACSGSWKVTIPTPVGPLIIEGDHDDNPKNPDPPAPDPDQDTPSDQITLNGDEYDIYGSDCPTWAVNSNTGRMFYLTNCSGDLAITAPGGGGNGTGGSSGITGDASTIGSVQSVGWAGQPIDPVIRGSFEDALQDEISRGFGGRCPSNRSCTQCL